MKKIIALLMLSVLLVSCGGGNGKNEEPTPEPVVIEKIGVNEDKHFEITAEEFTRRFNSISEAQISEFKKFPVEMETAKNSKKKKFPIYTFHNDLVNLTFDQVQEKIPENNIMCFVTKASIGDYGLVMFDSPFTKEGENSIMSVSMAFPMSEFESNMKIATSLLDIVNGKDYADSKKALDELMKIENDNTKKELISIGKEYEEKMDVAERKFTDSNGINYAIKVFGQEAILTVSPADAKTAFQLYFAAAVAGGVPAE